MLHYNLSHSLLRYIRAAKEYEKAKDGEDYYYGASERHELEDAE